MKTILHKASSRGHAQHGWLDSYHSFSFADYHHPDRMNFGALRVLNDDCVAPGNGFGTHPHSNMEIISIPLAGDLEHKDSMGNVAIIREGDVQALSAGTGIHHSEYNKNKDQEVRFLQIWISPKLKQVAPLYDQVSLTSIEKKNQFYHPIKQIKVFGFIRMLGFIWGSFKRVPVIRIDSNKQEMVSMPLFWRVALF
jgi:redox-sensitive bicupin YhaK (pirin superfamily)